MNKSIRASKLLARHQNILKKVQYDKLNPENSKRRNENLLEEEEDYKFLIELLKDSLQK